MMPTRAQAWTGDARPAVQRATRWSGPALAVRQAAPPLVLLSLLAAAAMTSGCATWAPRPNGKERTMSNEQPAPATRGVTVTLLRSFDLGPEIEGLAGRQFRMRLVTIEPGGVFGPLHDHKDRPGLVYVLQGTITDHRNGVATDYGPGAGWPEDRNTVHWLENRGATAAVEVSVDIVRQN